MAGAADLAMESVGECVAVTVTVLEVASTVPPVGAVPGRGVVDDGAVVDVGLGHDVRGGEDGFLAGRQ